MRLEEQAKLYAAQRDQWAARESRLSWARLLVFLAGVGGVWLFGWLGGGYVWAVPAVVVVALVVFLGAVSKHQLARDERENGDRLLLMVEETRQRVGGQVRCVRDWKRPEDAAALDACLPQRADDGPVWELTQQELDDLDVFTAPVGIFGLLNRTSTAFGARRLRDMLLRPLLASERIRARQQAVQWLQENADARLRLLAACAALRSEGRRLNGFVEALAQARPLRLFAAPKWLRIISVFTGFIALFAAAQVFVGQWFWLGPLGLMMVVNGTIMLRCRDEISAARDPWRDVAWAAKGCLSAARQAALLLPEQTLLADLRTRCAAVTGPHALPSLLRRINWAEGGGVMQMLFNLLFCYDLHVTQAILNRAVPHRDALLAAVAALAELEAYLSLAAFAWEQPVACFPQPAPQLVLSIRGGRHPLVDAARVVPNDARLDAHLRVWVITGSNMAGKSTFLRMVGVNALLAQVGGAVTAEAMDWSPLRLVTDLRARDNLANDESYFLAEVRHLRRLVFPPAGAEPVLGLIDEPFRGTNSDDQTAASIAVLKHLLESPHMFLLATHDRHLTTLADGRVAQNFHFRENLSERRDGGMVFDYKLHTGPATTRNALRVLEREGYPPRLLQRAHEWLGERDRDTYAVPTAAPPPS